MNRLLLILITLVSSPLLADQEAKSIPGLIGSADRAVVTKGGREVKRLAKDEIKIIAAFAGFTTWEKTDSVFTVSSTEVLFYKAEENILSLMIIGPDRVACRSNNESLLGDYIVSKATVENLSREFTAQKQK